jgi:predicted RNA binding protein YcfA (HicA-like mRNA interferase family)
MPKLPNVTGPEAIRAFERIGFQVVRVRSSHHVMKRVGHPFSVVVPVHGNQSIPPGTLRALIRSAGIDVERFVELLR